MSKYPDEQIRNYAQQLWEKAGRPEGRSDDFWRQAEIELDAEGEGVDPKDRDAEWTEDAAFNAGDNTRPSAIAAAAPRNINPTRWLATVALSNCIDRQNRQHCQAKVCSGFRNLCKPCPLAPACFLFGKVIQEAIESSVPGILGRCLRLIAACANPNAHRIASSAQFPAPGVRTATRIVVTM